MERWQPPVDYTSTSDVACYRETWHLPFSLSYDSKRPKGTWMWANLWSLSWAAEALVPGSVHVLAAVTEGRNEGSSKRLVFVYSSQYGCRLGLLRKRKLINQNKKDIPMSSWALPWTGCPRILSFPHCSRMKRIDCKYRKWGKAHLCSINKRYWRLFRIFLFLGISCMCVRFTQSWIVVKYCPVMHSESLVLMAKASFWYQMLLHWMTVLNNLI